ncbi:hypothetical protein F9U64_04435 [Gracilibacillus oryzae]|uniref:Cxxc_20_cxxc protein n=1 Tax=Gracilibacillus oryzae TaxID=1672701 RepID=A0A7C8GV56_9BACI|nr:TIGR04104 family putative zinc finger protein [Gracilibacillus oryzae]KAB8138525.1 hypothetical protein F9U64_04435 [Gracilibacillus oryzae]
MPVCQICHKTWSWKQTIKKSFTLDTGMNCPYCGEKQYVTTKTRKITALITFAVPVIMLVNLFFGASLVFLFLLIGVVFLFFGTYPFYMKLSNEEETIW